MVDAHESNGCLVGLALVLGGGERQVAGGCSVGGEGRMLPGLGGHLSRLQAAARSSVPWASLLAPLSWLFLSPESVRGSVRHTDSPLGLSAPCQPASVCFLSSRSVSRFSCVTFSPLFRISYHPVSILAAQGAGSPKARLDFVPDVSVQSENRAAERLTCGSGRSESVFVSMMLNVCQ